MSYANEYKMSLPTMNMTPRDSDAAFYLATPQPNMQHLQRLIVSMYGMSLIESTLSLTDVFFVGVNGKYRRLAFVHRIGGLGGARSPSTHSL